MAYQSKYTGLQIDDILDSVGSKQNEIEDLDQIRAGAGKGATALQSYTEKYTGTVTGIKMNGSSKGTEGIIDLGTVITAHQDISGKQDKLVSGTNIKTINGTSILGSGDIVIEGGESLTELDIAAMGFTKNTGTYSKPSGGIPTSDLDDMTQEVLTDAHSDHQLIQDINADIANLYNVKQDNLVSGTNIKTINGTSLLGSGNIVISGGGSGGGSGAYSEVSHGTSDTTFTLTPNVFHVWDEVTSLTLTLGDETAGVANEFLFQFNSGSTATTLTLPDTIKWANDSAPTIESNMIYQVSILKGLASVLEFKGELIRFYIRKGTLSQHYYGEENMTWKDWINSSYNTDGYSILGNLIVDNSSMYNISFAISTDTIIPNYVYDLVLGGGGPS